LGAGSVPVVVGPTAAGKSAVALWLADRDPVVVISADSRQVYRRFDVGTAKPSRAERIAVPHEGIDVVEATERYSAFQWAHAAGAWIGAARQAGRTALVVGGTGMYVRALFEPGFDEPPIDEARRDALRLELGQLHTPELRRWCERLDPARAHLGRAQLLRGVEIPLLLGRRLSDLHAERRREPAERARYLVVDPGPELRGRIEARVHAMFDAGWPAEVEGLMTSVPDDAPAWQSTGYRCVRDYVSGRMSRAAAVERVAIETRQYAKRQRTWFRHQLPPHLVTHVDPAVPGWERIVDRWWTERSEDDM